MAKCQQVIGMLNSESEGNLALAERPA